MNLNQATTFQRLTRKRLTAASFGVLLLAGCAVGPDFKTPAALTEKDDVSVFSRTSLAQHTASAPTLAGEAQRFAQAQTIPAQWWTVFHSEALDQLVRLGLSNSPTLLSAQATLRQAQENYSAQAGTFFPSIGVGGNASHQRSPFTQTQIPGGTIYSLFNASVNVSYTVDVFGGQRRTLENLGAAVDYQRYQVEAAYLSLTSNIVTTAIQEAALRAQIAATQELLSAQEKALSLVEQQERFGSISRGPVLTQRTLVTQTRAQLPALKKSQEQMRHQLTLLVGKLPNEAGLPSLDLTQLQLPKDLPVSLPSELVRQRPDIRASEALLHQANAQVGVATANLYPSITLTASDGSSTFRFKDLFSNGFGFWSLIGSVTSPILDGGTLRAKRRASEAALDAAAGQYKQTVLVAFQNVANALSALQHDATTLQMQAEAELVARESLDMTNNQYQFGSVNILSVLDAQRSYQQARIALIQAQTARFTDSAALFQALGGGWWNRTEAIPEVKLVNESKSVNNAQ